MALPFPGSASATTSSRPASCCRCLGYSGTLPTFFLDTGYRGFNPLMLPGFALGIFAGAVVLTWLHEGACSSVLIVALWHAFLNLGSATKAGEGAVQASVTMLVIVWSLVIARTWRRGAEGAPGHTGRPAQRSAA